MTLDGNVNYQHSRNELQPNANLDTWQFSYGGQVMVHLPAGFEISTNIHENSRRGYNDPSSNTNELIWNGQISKTFLKSKTLVVALNFYDLLGQQSNYERWVGAMVAATPATTASTRMPCSTCAIASTCSEERSIPKAATTINGAIATVAGKNIRSNPFVISA